MAIGVAGRGFDGNLTSDSTRLDGYVLSTDVAPTVLDWFGVGVPSQMSGQPLRSEGKVDPGAIEALGERMAVISERRGPVVGLSLLAWILALGLAVGLPEGGPGGPGCESSAWLSSTCRWCCWPAAAVEPGETVEMLMALLGRRRWRR